MGSGKNLLATHLGILPRTAEERILRLLIELGIQIVGADEGSLLVYDEDSKDLRFAMTGGSKTSESALIGQHVPLGKGITGLAASTHEVQIGAPTYKDVRQSKARGGKSGAPEAVLAAPMLVGDALIGALTAVSFQKGKRFNQSDAKLYAGFASIAGVVVDQRRRLAAAEAGKGKGGRPKALGETGRLEEQILASVSRLVQKQPETLGQVAKLLAAVEAMVLPRKGSGS